MARLLALFIGSTVVDAALYISPWKRFDYNFFGCWEVEHLHLRSGSREASFGLVNMTNVAVSSVGGRLWTMG